MFCVCVISGFGVGSPDLEHLMILGAPTLTIADFTSKLQCNVTDALTGVHAVAAADHWALLE